MTSDGSGAAGPRRRRDPETARAEAVAAARRLLMAKGPSALTLKAVAEDVGVTHAALLHHFGSAYGLQTALMAAMVRDLESALRAAMEQIRVGAAPPATLVRVVFDVFSEGGGGRLAAWLALTGDLKRLDPVRDALNDLVATVLRELGVPGDREGDIGRAIHFITLSAFADAVIGPQVSAMLGLPSATARETTLALAPLVAGSSRPDAGPARI